MKLEVETARELAYSPVGETFGGFEVVVNELDSTDRWSEIHHLVILNPYLGRYWETHYSIGATEYQDERPFEEEDEVEFLEVVPVEVIRVEYQRV